MIVSEKNTALRIRGEGLWSFGNCEGGVVVADDAGEVEDASAFDELKGGLGVGRAEVVVGE
jgi:hypothetical protein